jgi:hypothetical protein
VKGDSDPKPVEIGPLDSDDSTDRLGQKIIKYDAELTGLEDPVALKTRWSPLIKKGGINFQTYALYQVTPLRLEFRTSVFVKILSAIFIASGIGIPLSVSILTLIHGTYAIWMISSIVIGFICFAAGGLFRYWYSTPSVFDREAGLYWKNRNILQEITTKNALKISAHLADIHAIQLISKSVHDSGDKQSYRSHEINLVLKDSSRINVVDHSKMKIIYENAVRLSRFLEIPVWDKLSR